MKTIDELLIGTKYEGARTMTERTIKAYTEAYVEGKTHVETTINEADMELDRDSRANAALASLLPAAVKALDGQEKFMTELLGYLKPLDVLRPAVRCKLGEVKHILARIAEVTNTVEGK